MDPQGVSDPVGAYLASRRICDSLSAATCSLSWSRSISLTMPINAQAITARIDTRQEGINVLLCAVDKGQGAQSVGPGIWSRSAR
jgi:hypothetical protein